MLGWVLIEKVEFSDSWLIGRSGKGCRWGENDGRFENSLSENQQRVCFINSSVFYLKSNWYKHFHFFSIDVKGLNWIYIKKSSFDLTTGLQT